MCQECRRLSKPHCSPSLRRTRHPDTIPALKVQSHGASSTELWLRTRNPHHIRTACQILIVRHWTLCLGVLRDEALLERCSYGITHNSNESLHAMICEQVPKTQQASLHSTERAISHFNQGVTKNNAQISCKMSQNVAKVAK